MFDGRLGMQKLWLHTTRFGLCGNSGRGHTETYKDWTVQNSTKQNLAFSLLYGSVSTQDLLQPTRT
jgi:hypothetical protein